MNFVALDVSLQLVHELREPVRAIRSCDRDLAEQLRKAASSVALNLSEGSQRLGRDRQHHYAISSGSAAEVETALRLAVAWGHVGPEQVATALQLVDRVRALLWRLTRGR